MRLVDGHDYYVRADPSGHPLEPWLEALTAQAPDSEQLEAVPPSRLVSIRSSAIVCYRPAQLLEDLWPA